MTRAIDPTVFYSWQSDLAAASNRSLIGDALAEAIRALASDASIVHAPRLDHDTQGVPGAPDIGATVLAKIDAAAVFVADVSLAMQDPATRKKAPNANVLFELGYAWKALGPGRVILIMNEHFGSLLELPFDLRSKLVLTYRNDPDISERASTRRELSSKTKAQIRGILDAVNASQPDGGTVYGANNAARIIAEDSLAKLARPYREVTIEPLSQRPPDLDQLAFAREARSLANAASLAERAGFPSLAPHPNRAPFGLFWEQAPSGGGKVECVLAVGFDGSFCFAATLWESQRTGLSWGPDGVDVGSCIDAMIASIAFAARLRAKVGVTRPARGTFHLNGIRNRYPVYGAPPRKDWVYPAQPHRAQQDVFQQGVDLAAEFVADGARDATLAICKKLEYVMGSAFDSDYVRRRIDLALGET